MNEPVAASTPAVPDLTTRTAPAKVALFCLHDRQVHEFTIAELEELVYALQGGEHDAATEPRGPARQPDTFDCLQDWLRLAGEPEGYAEHVTQQVLRRRDLAGPHEGDEDLCRHCGEQIEYSSPYPGARPGWRHRDPDAAANNAAAGGSVHLAEPDPERQP